MRAARQSAVCAAIIFIALNALACTSAEQIPETEIHATDYAFRAPTHLPAGRAALRLVNDGTVWHEAQVFRFRPGMDAALAGRLLAADSLPDAARDSTGGVLIAGAKLRGDQALLLTLAHGELYGILCEFRDGEGKPKHVKLGMFALVRVD